MTWTPSRPTVPGFYFWRFFSGDRHPLIGEVSHHSLTKVLIVMFAEDQAESIAVKNIGGQWCGPFYPPKGETVDSMLTLEALLARLEDQEMRLRKLEQESQARRDEIQLASEKVA